MIVDSRELGRRIRETRRERRMTLRQVETLADVSTTHLSQIERGQTSPTIGVLARIARALGRSSSYFVEREERPEISHLPTASRDRFELSPGVTCETLTAGPAGSRMCAYRLRFAGEGASLGLASRESTGESLYLVVRGRLEADFGFGPMPLAAGDAVQASFARPHQLVAIGDGAIEVLAVLTDTLTNHRDAHIDRGSEAASTDSAPPAGSNAICEVTMGLARQIKQTRASLGLTLKDIEERGGISATHVSEIERGKASPTVLALGRIAQALGLRAAAMVDPPVLPEVSVVSPGDLGDHTLRWGDATLEPLTEPVKDGALGAHVLRLPVGDRPALTHRHEGEEWLTALSGVAEVRVKDARYLLLEGDSLHFHAHVAHSYANPGSTPAVLLVACRPRIRL